MDAIIGSIGFVMRLPITILGTVIFLVWSVLVSVLVTIFVVLVWIVIAPIFWLLVIPFRLLTVPMRGGAKKLQNQLHKNVGAWYRRVNGSFQHLFQHLFRLWADLASWQTGRSWRPSPR